MKKNIDNGPETGSFVTEVGALGRKWLSFGRGEYASIEDFVREFAPNQSESERRIACECLRMVSLLDGVTNPGLEGCYGQRKKAERQTARAHRQFGS